jgi:hypothetical protein
VLRRVALIQNTPERNQQPQTYELARQLAQDCPTWPKPEIWRAIYEMFTEGILVPVAPIALRNPHTEGLNLWQLPAYSITAAIARLRPSLVRAWISSRSNSANSAEDGQHQPSVRRRRVRPGVAERAERGPFRRDGREGVEVPRGSRQTVEPRHEQHVAGSCAAMPRRNCAGSVLVPLATSRNTCAAPAARKAATCAATLWPSVDTRA